MFPCLPSQVRSKDQVGNREYLRVCCSSFFSYTGVRRLMVSSGFLTYSLIYETIAKRAIKRAIDLSEPSSTDIHKKLQWQCRRGMLELDVILQPFLEQYFLLLIAEDQKAFVDLLTEADPDLYTWIMGFGDCKNEALHNIIAIIRNKMSIA